VVGTPSRHPPADPQTKMTQPDDFAPLPAIPRITDAAEEGGDDITVARDYLQQLQERSIRGLAEWLHGAFQGNWHTEAEHIDATIKRIRGARANADFELGRVVPQYSCAIEQICETLKLPLRGGVASGAVYQPRDVPAQTPVFGTNASVIVIPEHTLMLCHFMCKALSWAFPIEEQPGRYAVSFKAKRVLKRFRRDPRLTAYLARTLAFSATHDRRCLDGVKFESLSGGPRLLAIELLCATEIFVIAHEYGHHIDEHKLGDSADVEGLIGDNPIIEELRADYLASLITAHFGATFKPPNPWAASAAVAIVALGSTDLVFRTRSFLESGVDRVRSSNTHPPMMVRMIAVERLNRRYDPRERAKMRNLRREIRHIMTNLWDVIRPELERLRDRGLCPLPISAEDAQWLP
jgi:hypothetical protein